MHLPIHSFDTDGQVLGHEASLNSLYTNCFQIARKVGELGIIV